jgi:hypothetical protein
MGGEEGGRSLGGKLVSGAAKGTGKLAAGTTKVALKTSAQVAGGLAEGALDAARDGQVDEQEPQEVQEGQEGEEGEEGEEETAEEDLSSKLVKGAARGTGKFAVIGGKAAGKAGAEAGKAAGRAAGKAGADLASGAASQARKEAQKNRAYYGPYCCCSRPYDDDQREWNPNYKQPGAYSNPLTDADESDEDED